MEFESKQMDTLLVLVVSGKRKSGKDFVTDRLFERLGKDVCSLVRTAGPIKYQFCKDHHLDYDKMLDSSGYKEIYRRAMIEWSDAIRDQDHGYFCRLAVSEAGVRPVLIVTDARRKTDFIYFTQFCRERTALIKTVRVQASPEVRKRRGWQFMEGVDDVASECDLDDIVNWDYVIKNNGASDDDVDSFLETIVHLVSQSLIKYRHDTIIDS